MSIGSGDSVELRLHSEGVAGIHCMLSVEHGSINVKDCYSQTGTYVDGQRIQDIQVDDHCQIRIGSNVLTLQFKQSRAKSKAKSKSASPSEFNISELFREELSKPVPLTEDELASVLCEDGPEMPSPSAMTNLLYELEEAQNEVAILRERLSKTTAKQPIAEIDPYQEEMIALLKEEVSSLQKQLAERDIVEIDSPLVQERHDYYPDREEVEKLVFRLERLFDELEEKDLQIRSLQDLILAAESANQAEKEEREHLARWLGEFESRFEKISAEWSLENEQLKGRIAVLSDNLNDARDALSADSSTAKNEAIQRMNETLRQQVITLQDSLDQLTDDNGALKRRLLSAQNSSSREEEIKLARERAEIARMRHDLEKRMQKASDATPAPVAHAAKPETPEMKLRSIREELRESVHTEKPTATLSSRLMNLWNKLGSVL